MQNNMDWNRWRGTAFLSVVTDGGCCHQTLCMPVKTGLQMIQTFFKWLGAIPLTLRASFVCLCSMAALHGQETNAVSPTNLLQRAWSEFSSNEYVQAEESFRIAILAAPTNANAYAGLGRSLYQLKQYPAAITNLERALALQPGHTNWLLFLGESYSSAGNSSKAANVFQQYVSLRTNDDEGNAWLSFVLYQQAQYDRAASAAKSGITLNPSNTFCFRQLGYSLEQLNRHADAVQAFRHAIALDPTDGDTYFQCGMSLFPLGRFEEAATNFETACAIQKDNRWAHLMLFSCYLSLLQPQKACQVFPAICAIGRGAVMLAYLVTMGTLLLLSFRIHSKPFFGRWFSVTAWSWGQSDVGPKAFPSIRFSLAWLAAYGEGQFAFLFVPGMFSRIKPAESLVAIATLASIPVLIVGMLGFHRQPWGKPFAWPLRFGTKKTLWLGLFGLVLVWLFSWVYTGLVQFVTHHTPVQETMTLIGPGLKTHPLFSFAAIAIFMPVVEEILFRGLLFGALERRLPPAGVIMVTSLVFALCHFQIVFFIPILGVGILLGWARLKTGSIGLPILIHALNNGLSVLMVIFAS